MKLRIENVTKKYNDLVALNNVSLEIPEQSIFGLLGPNGAGKTSLIRIINQIIGMDSGKIYLNGEKLKQYHTEKIGYLPEERGLYDDMKIGEELIYLAKLKGLTPKNAKEKIKEWMRRFKIEDWWDKKVNELSKGMQQKVQFITTIVHEPELIIFDEPFTGLDPVNTNLIKSEILKLRDRGTTIIFSTHRMEQIEEICEDIALINNGNIVLKGKIEDIKQTYKKNHYRLNFSGKLPEIIQKKFKIIETFNHEVIVELEHEIDSEEFLKSVLGKVRIKSFDEILPSLNEIFIGQVEGDSFE